MHTHTHAFVRTEDFSKLLHIAASSNGNEKTTERRRIAMHFLQCALRITYINRQIRHDGCANQITAMELFSEYLSAP